MTPLELLATPSFDFLAKLEHQTLNERALDLSQLLALITL